MLCYAMLCYVMLCYVCMYVCVCVCAKVHLRNLHQVVVACVGSCPSFQLLVLRKARWAVESGQDSNSKEAQSGGFPAQCASIVAWSCATFLGHNLDRRCGGSSAF